MLSPIDFTRKKDVECTVIDGVEWCKASERNEKKKCVKFGEGFLCRDDVQKNTTLKREVGKFKGYLFKPTLGMDESKQTEYLFVEFTIGVVISALIFVMSSFIIDIVDYVLVDVFMIDGGVMSSVIVVIAIILIMIFLSFLQYRLTKAFAKTNVMEQFSEKSPMDILNMMFDQK